MAETHTETASPGPREIESSREMWHNFTTLMKYSCAGVAAILLLMLFFIY